MTIICNASTVLKNVKARVHPQITLDKTWNYNYTMGAKNCTI